MRFYVIYAAFLAFIHSTEALALLKTGAPLYLEVGEQRILTFPGIERYTISGDSIRYVRLSNTQELLIKAVKPGLSTLFLSFSPQESESRLIRVENKKNLPYPSTLLQALNRLQKTEVIDQGTQLVLRGLINEPTEAAAVGALKDHFQAFIIDETRLTEPALLSAKLALQKLIEPHPSLSLETREGAIAIHGGLPNLALKEALTKKIKAIQPLTQIDIQTMKDTDPTLYFKIFLLEIRKETLSSLGMEWPALHPAALNLVKPALLLGESLDLTIHALSQKGLARVLSSPELVVKAPGQAELFAGGELPIRQKNKFNDSVTWKNVGLSLKLDVKEYGGEKVRLTVETEMSHLDQALMNDNIPGVQTNRIKTLVDGTLGKPLLLSGLLQENLHETAKGLPLLSQIPMLGKLFSSEDYQNNRSELVAILLPHREPPKNPLNRVSGSIPKGYLPLPRHHLKAEQVEQAKRDRNYPWNVL